MESPAPSKRFKRNCPRTSVDLPVDPFPFDPEGPHAGNRGRLLFSELVHAAVDAGQKGDIHGMAAVTDKGVSALSDGDLRAIVKFAVGLVSAQRLGLENPKP